MFDGFIKLCEKHELSCSERFLLASLVLCTDSDDEWLTAKQLSERLAVSLYMTSSGLAALARIGCVVTKREVSSGESRSSRMYKVNPESVHSFGDEYWPGQKSLVKLLLLGQNLGPSRASIQQESVHSVDGRRPPVRTKSVPPLPSMRLVMAILAGYSDVLGLVQGGNTRSLRNLTGLSTSRVRNHIREASDVLSVLTVIPGFTSRLFKPAKQASSYYLRLDELTQNVQPDRFGFHFVATTDHFAAVLRDKKLQKAKKLIAGMRPQEVAVLMAKLTHEVSLLLSEQWEKLDSPNMFYFSHESVSELSDRVEEFLAKQDGGDISNGGPVVSGPQHEELVLYIVKMACIVKRWLSVRGLSGVQFKRVQVSPFRFDKGEYLLRIFTLASGHQGPGLILSLE